MLANNELNQRTTMKAIAIISQQGGVGKTTIGIHLAVVAEQRGLKTALFDLDPHASASSWSDKRNKPLPAESATSANAPLLTAARRAV
jgi:chromosome partitioning protein